MAPGRTPAPGPVRAPRQALRVLGVMTGTSCDGLDAACIEIGPTSWRPLWGQTAPYPRNLREQVLRLQKPGRGGLTLQEWLELGRQLGEWYGSSLKRIINVAGRPKPHVIANHGQTIAHFPAPNRRGITLQIGDPTRISHATGLTVVSNFREGDMAAGGQGAPLVPLFHRLLARRLEAPPGVSLHNIGGISNLTYLGPRDKLLAFDTGPGNIWIDAAATEATAGRLKLDRDGRLAARGVVDQGAVHAVLAHPYFGKAAPKSTGRDDFPFELLLSHTRARGEDLVATATAITAESIAQSYEHCVLRQRLPLSAVYLCGGGARNPTLVRWLQERLDKVRISTLAELGFDAQMIEAQAFAYFGYLSLRGQPLGGSWTGARGYAPPGHVIPGTNWAEVLRRVGV